MPLFPAGCATAAWPGRRRSGRPCPQLSGSPLGHTSTIALPTCPGRQQQGWAELRQHPKTAGAFIPEPQACQPHSSSSLRKPRLRRLTGFPTQHASGLHPLGGTSGRPPARTRSPRSLRAGDELGGGRAGGQRVVMSFRLEKFEDNLTLP